MDISTEKLFTGASGAYGLYRPAYPARLFREILARLTVPLESALDIGAGTGLSTAALAEAFGHVTAAEPDGAMLARARFAPNVTVLQKGGEELDFAPGSFGLITCGNAFYWMDGETLAPALHRWLCAGGLFAAFRYEMPLTTSPAANAVIQAEDATHWDAHRNGRLRDTGYTLRTLQQAGCFATVESLRVENKVSMAAGQLAGFFASTSYGSAWLATLPSPGRYIAGLAERLGGENKPLTVDFGLELVLAKK